MADPTPSHPTWTPDPDQRAGLLADLLADRDLPGFAALHAWSVADPAGYWERVWRDAGVVGTMGTPVLVDRGFSPSSFFPAARLNVVDTLLAGDDDAAAIIAVDQTGARTALDRRRLRAEVAAVAAALRSDGVGVGDRVAAWTGNQWQTVAFTLGALSIGAVVSTASADFAPQGVIDRFGQVGPVVLLSSTKGAYGERVRDLGPLLPEALAGLPSVRRTVVLDPVPGSGAVGAGSTAGGAGGDSGSTAGGAGAITWEEWLAPHRGAPLAPVPLPFDHPGFILFTSGTTGRPKCIVHAAAGILLKVASEQAHHLGIRRGDRVLYYTTTGWMMWNWLLMALGRQATIVLYDGHPMFPDPLTLPRLAAAEQVTFLGLSAALIDALRVKGVRPGADCDLSAVRTIAATGSPLAADCFDYVWTHLSDRAHLVSLSGGTDICGCFLLGAVTEPVHRGELSVPALGLAVDIVEESGVSVPPGGTGELICRAPFPSCPIGFWGDTDGSRMHAAYFAALPGVWTHGDFVTRSRTGGYVIEGRSDATLNVNGVRIGPAEITRPLTALPWVAEAIPVAWRSPDGERIVLFLRLEPPVADGVLLDPVRGTLSAHATGEVRTVIGSRASPRHVPAVIAAAPDLPRTRSGKLAELAVADVVNGRPVRSTEGLANPEALAWFAAWAAAPPS